MAAAEEAVLRLLARAPAEAFGAGAPPGPGEVAWARAVQLTRAFEFELPSGAEGEGEGAAEAVLVPLVDLVNHGGSAGVNAAFELAAGGDGGGVVRLAATMAVTVGEQVMAASPPLLS
jgi:hypothetical protein